MEPTFKRRTKEPTGRHFCGQLSPYLEELRLLGEAIQVPDDELTKHGDSEPGRQRTRETLVRYPDGPITTESEYSSCESSIPASQTKCWFCLTNHLDVSNDKQQSSDTEWILLHVVHLLVEASTIYSTVAKGAATATLLAKPTGIQHSTKGDGAQCYSSRTSQYRHRRHEAD
jgi:hypothetical protein